MNDPTRQYRANCEGEFGAGYRCGGSEVGDNHLRLRLAGRTSGTGGWLPGSGVGARAGALRPGRMAGTTIKARRSSTAADHNSNGTSVAPAHAYERWLAQATATGLCRREATELWRLVLAAVDQPSKGTFADCIRRLTEHLDLGSREPIALWSGGMAASEHARGLGYATIENTRFARILEGVDINGDPGAFIPLWKHVSAEFVSRNARGDVHIFLAREPREDGVLVSSELPALRALPAGTVTATHVHWIGPGRP